MTVRARFHQLLLENFPDEVARFLKGVSIEESVGFLQQFPPELTSKIFPYLNERVTRAILQNLSQEDLENLFPHLNLEISCHFLRPLNMADREPLLSRLDDDKRRAVEKALNFDSATAAGRARLDVLTFKPLDEVGIMVEVIRSKGRSDHYLYGVDERRRLKGVISVSQMLCLDPKAVLFDHMKTQVMTLNANMALVEVCQNPGWTRYIDLPVVTDENVLIGGLSLREVYTDIIDMKKNDISLLTSASRRFGDTFKEDMKVFSDSLKHRLGKDRR